MDTIVDLITKLGLPLALLIVLLYGIWRAALWARDNILMPLTNGHLTFLHKVDETQQKQQQSLEKLTDLQGQQATIMTRQATTLEQISQALDSLACRNGKPNH